MTLKETILKIKNKPYIEVVLTSANNISKRYHIEDIGYRWLVDEKLGLAFVLPDTRITGIRDGRKTTLFYSVENALPLTLQYGEDITKEKIYWLNEKNQLIPQTITTDDLKSKKVIKPNNLIPAVIDSRVLASLINQKVVTDLLKPSQSKWEALKLPLVVAGIAACIIGIAMI